MTSKKGQRFKQGLIKEAEQNKNAPVWVYLKTGDRDKIMGGKTNWRAPNSKKGKRVRDKLTKVN